MSSKTVKALVTGGCGFIGSHLVDLLVENNYEVLSIDNLSAVSNSKFYYNPQCKYYNYDICDENLPHQKLFEDVKYVFHLAAESRIGPAINNPIHAATVNVVGTTKMLQYSRMYSVNKFLYSSTSSVYGNESALPINERAKIDCLNPYSATKFSGEEMVRMYNKLYKLNTVIFRYFNVFGERSPYTGQYAPVIGIFQRQKQNNEHLTIVGDGKQTRDFIHVKDIARANLLAAENTNCNNILFNVGSGTNISINQIAKMISPNVVYLPPRAGEAKDTLADISLIKEKLNFVPSISVQSFLNP